MNLTNQVTSIAVITIVVITKGCKQKSSALAGRKRPLGLGGSRFSLIARVCCIDLEYCWVAQ